MVNALHIDQLLSNTKRIIAHQHELEKLRGETFNIFSVLGLERYENRTHSAFLGELLNPKGSHLKGFAFLKLFLEVFEITHVDIETAELHLEYHIGTRDDIKKQGGRIDIFIKDRNYNAIAIENKIDAGDQYAQIERYCNYRNKNYKVFYLTINGDEPSLESKGALTSGQDYNLLSYKDDILKWLELCYKEAADTPILRETIKQYILLIKKITSTMDNQSEKELIDLMFKYYEESAFIANNFNKVRQTIGEEIRQSVIAELTKKLLPQDYIIEPGSDATKNYSQIWLYLNQFPDSVLTFGIESFSGIGWHDGNLFIGVFNDGETKSQFGLQYDNSNTNKWWVDQCLIKDLHQTKINLSNPDTLKKLSNSAEFKNEFVNHIVSEIIEYLNLKTPQLISFLEQQ